jgi:hypothetical protein
VTDGMDLPGAFPDGFSRDRLLARLGALTSAPTGSRLLFQTLFTPLMMVATADTPWPGQRNTFFYSSPIRHRRNREGIGVRQLFFVFPEPPIG